MTKFSEKMIKIRLTRDSVTMGDDSMAPHEKLMSLPESSGLKGILSVIIDTHYLASIHGGKATWSVSSERPLAIIAQQWNGFETLPETSQTLKDLHWQDGVLQIHCAYHQQKDPWVVYYALS